LRIATYNIWNSTLNWPQRVAALAEELVILDADIVALQEAPTQATENQTIVEARMEADLRAIFEEEFASLLTRIPV
jgi:endonuclease/exonuclease/phosphatase family metal-dependent hydrolase